MVILTYGPYVLPICAQYFRIAPTGLALHFGEVERMSTDKPGFYRLLMPNISHSSKGVGLECQIIETVADALLYTGLDFELVDTSLSPILDQFDVSPEQTYHQIKTSEGHCRTLKLYPFDNYRSSVFKHGLSQISMYRNLSDSPLLDYFILCRGVRNVLVLVFRFYECSLIDLVHYRHLLHSPWTDQEIVSIALILLRQYKQLWLCGIAHRDIRLGKIYYTPQPADNTLDTTFSLLLNLEAGCRVPYQNGHNMPYHINEMAQNSNEMTTVRGVNVFAADPVRSYIEKGTEVANYQLQIYDLRCIALVIRSLVQLSVFPSTTKLFQDTSGQIITTLESAGNWMQVEQSLTVLLKDFDVKMKFGLDHTLSKILSMQQLPRLHKQRIKTEQLHALFLLHKTNAFKRILLPQLDNNLAQEDWQASLDILERLGLYFEEIGIRDNDYYREQLQVLLQLAEKHRRRGSIANHYECIQKAEKVFDKLSPKMKSVAAECALLREGAYALMKYEKQQLRAEEAINQAIVLGDYNQQLPVTEQLKLLEVKGIIDLSAPAPDFSSKYLEKGLEISSQRSLFATKQEHLYFKAQFKYLNSRMLLRLLVAEPVERRADSIGNAKGLLLSALSDFKMLPLNSAVAADIVRCYCELQDLCVLGEAYEEGFTLLVKADGILQVQEHQGDPVGNDVKLVLLEKLKMALGRRGEQRTYYDEVSKQINQLRRSTEESNGQRLLRIQKDKKAKGKAKRKIFDISEEQEEEH